MVYTALQSDVIHRSEVMIPRGIMMSDLQYWRKIVITCDLYVSFFLKYRHGRILYLMFVYKNLTQMRPWMRQMRPKCDHTYHVFCHGIVVFCHGIYQNRTTYCDPSDLIGCFEVNTTKVAFGK